MSQSFVIKEKMHPQMPLDIGMREEFSFDNFIPDLNLAALNSLKQQLSPEKESYLYLWGKSGVGLSHLLQAACQNAGEQNISSIYLPMNELAELSPEILMGVEKIALVCIDNLEQIAQRQDWEIALFNLFNGIKQQQGALLVAASATPQNLGIDLPDLVSRLTSGITYHIKELSEEGKLELLKQRAKLVGLELSEETSQFILNRSERSSSELITILSNLDRASLSSARKLTIPFIKQVMGW